MVVAVGGELDQLMPLEIIFIIAHNTKSFSRQSYGAASEELHPENVLKAMKHKSFFLQPVGTLLLNHLDGILCVHSECSPTINLGLCLRFAF